MKQIKLNSRQWKLYTFIKHTSLYEHRAVSQKEIVEMNSYNKLGNPDGYKWKETSHDHCASIWSDINKLNMSSQIDKIIIWDSNYNYKLAENLKEVKEFIEELYFKKAMAKLYRYSQLLKKARLDNQMVLLDHNNNEITSDSVSRDFIEVFANKYNNEKEFIGK